MSQDNIMKRSGDYFGCRHSKFLVDETLDYVECGLCGKHLNPMWVLGQLCSRESLAQQRVDSLHEIAKNIEGKVRTKCQHCKKMTRINPR